MKLNLKSWNPSDLHRKSVQFCIDRSSLTEMGNATLDVQVHSDGMANIDIEGVNQTGTGLLQTLRIPLTQQHLDCLAPHPRPAQFHFLLVSPPEVRNRPHVHEWLRLHGL